MSCRSHRLLSQPTRLRPARCDRKSVFEHKTLTCHVFFCRSWVKLLLFKGSSSQIAVLWKVCFVLPLHLHTKWGSEWSTGAWPELIWVLMAIWLAWSRKAGCEDIHQRRWSNSLRLRNNQKEIHLLAYTCWDSPAANMGHLKASERKCEVNLQSQWGVMEGSECVAKDNWVIKTLMTQLSSASYKLIIWFLDHFMNVFFVVSHL